MKKTVLSTHVDAKVLFFLSGLWVLLIVIVNPIGNFPLIDDWSFGKTVQQLVDTGELSFTDWVSMPLITQIFWGAGFSLPFGFSFTALRFSTLTLALVGILATYILLRLSGGNKPIALIGALVFLSNPIFFPLSYTFMTDVPFSALFVGSLALLMHGIRSDSVTAIVSGLFVGLLALFIRQLGLAIFIAFPVGYLLRNGWTMKNMVVSFVPLMVSLMLYLGYGQLLEYFDELPKQYAEKSDRLVSNLLSKPLYKILIPKIITFWVYFGLFLLPFSIYSGLFSKSVKRNSFFQVGLGLGTVIIGAIAVFRGYSFPLLGDVLFDAGCGAPQFSLGPVMLRDVRGYCFNSSSEIPDVVRVIILFLGVVGGGAIFYRLCSIFQGIKQWEIGSYLKSNWDKFMLLSLVLAYLFPLALGPIFDRYLIPVLPALMALVIPRSLASQVNTAASLVPLSILLIYLLFSIIATHDFLEWNRARWTAVEYLEDELKVPPQKIDGGFEYIGWRYFSETKKNDQGKGWWRVPNPTYMITFNNIEAYEKIRVFPANVWMPGSKREVFVLKRDE